MSGCPDTASWEELASGVSSGTRAAELGAHLAACPECRGCFDQLVRNERVLGAVRVALGPEARTEPAPPAPAPNDRPVTDPDGAPAPDRAPPLAGRRIGRYELIRIIGTGGGGIVYEARQEQPERTVALKVVRGGPLADGHRLHLFQREIRSLARLRHPGIATIYEAGFTDDHQQYFAMELVEGVPLTVYAQHHELRLPERLRLVRTPTRSACRAGAQRSTAVRGRAREYPLVASAGHTPSLRFMHNPGYDVHRPLLPDALRVICERAPRRRSTSARPSAGRRRTAPCSMRGSSASSATARSLLFKEEVALLDRVIELDPSFSAAYYHRGGGRSGSAIRRDSTRKHRAG